MKWLLIALLNSLYLQKIDSSLSEARILSFACSVKPYYTFGHCEPANEEKHV